MGHGTQHDPCNPLLIGGVFVDVFIATVLPKSCAPQISWDHYHAVSDLLSFPCPCCPIRVWLLKARANIKSKRFELETVGFPVH